MGKSGIFECIAQTRSFAARSDKGKGKGKGKEGKKGDEPKKAEEKKKDEKGKGKAKPKEEPKAVPKVTAGSGFSVTHRSEGGASRYHALLPIGGRCFPTFSTAHDPVCHDPVREVKGREKSAEELRKEAEEKAAAEAAVELRKEADAEFAKDLAEEEARARLKAKNAAVTARSEVTGQSPASLDITVVISGHKAEYGICVSSVGECRGLHPFLLKPSKHHT